MPFRSRTPGRRILLAALVALAGSLVLASPAFAKRKNPVSKLYVADLKGDAEIDDGEKISDLKNKTVHDAAGSKVQTKDDASSALVYSNGTGVYLEPDTRMNVKSFVQEPFIPNRTDMEVEPSISKTETVVTHGTVGLCTSKMIAGSKMVYRTPHASVNIRGRRVVIQADDNETKVSLVEGDCTVSAGEKDVGGQVLHPGQQAIIRRVAPGTPGARIGPDGDAFSVVVQPIPPGERPVVEDKVVKACMARRTVYFEVADRKGDKGASDAVTAFTGDADDAPAPELVPVEVIAPPPPTEKPVSPFRLTE